MVEIVPFDPLAQYGQTLGFEDLERIPYLLDQTLVPLERPVVIPAAALGLCPV